MAFSAHPPGSEALLSALAELVAALSSELAPSDFARLVLRRGGAALGAAGGAARISDAPRPSTDIVETTSPAGVPAVVTDVLAKGDEAWVANDAGSLAAVELAAGARRVGVLAFWFDGPHTVSEPQRSFLRTVGALLAHAVDRSNLLLRHQAIERDEAAKARRADVLTDAFRLISSRPSLSHIMGELARVSCELPADFSAIRVLSADRKWLELRGLHHRDPAMLRELHKALDDQPIDASLGRTAAAIETGRSILMPTVDMEPLLRAYAGMGFGDYLARFPVSSLMVVPLASRGTVFGVVAVARSAPEPFQPADLRFLEDVAERALAALDTANLLETLTRSEEQLRFALEAGRLGAWDWNISAGSITWSTMLEKIHGRAPGTFEGTFEAYQHDIHPEDRDRVLTAIRHAVDAHADHHVVYRIVRPDGQMRWLEAQGRLFCDPDGAPQRLVGVCLDITDRRNSEEQLRQMVLALKDADQRKDVFLAMLAHELRNPLGPMLNATHLIRMSDPGNRWVEILDRQVGHMAHLLGDLLDVSRITQGKIELVREPVDLTALTREVVGDHQGAFEAAHLSVELKVSATPLVVHADRTRLAQIVGNLLSNALKFSQRDQTVHVTVERAAAGENVVLIVRDEGAGIEPALLASVFEPFVQAETSLSRHRGGLGLGLAVVKGLVVLHGGHVSASSPGLGGGAVLRVELPLHVELHEHAASRALNGGVAPDRPTVLIFEDNADAAESLCMILAATGYQPTVEETGRQAMEMVKRLHPAAVLCDLGLPDKDGFAIAAEIRADHEFARLPLIAISGYGSADDKARAQRAGFDLHLTKPVTPAILLSELARRLAPVSAG